MAASASGSGVPDPFVGSPAPDLPVFDTSPGGATCEEATSAAIGVLGIVLAVLRHETTTARDVACSMTFDYALTGSVSVMRTLLHGSPVRGRILDVVLLAAGARWSNRDLLRMLADVIEGVRGDRDEFAVSGFEPVSSAVASMAWLTHTVIAASAEDLREEPEGLATHLLQDFLRHLAEHHGGGATATG